MKRIPLTGLVLLTTMGFADPNMTKSKVGGGIGTDCKPPLKEYRAFIITKATDAPERNGWELSHPGGDTSDLMDCPDNFYWTLDVKGGQPAGTLFHFPNNEACRAALNTMKSATKELPVVLVIDKNCAPHLAQ